MTLSLTAVDKTYVAARKPPVHAVRGLNLEVRNGETVALLGSSGCGKTSTLRMLAGFEDVTTGTIELAGRRVDRLPPDKRNIAMAFESYALYPPLTVAENIGFALGRDRAGRDRRVREVADLLEITPILDRRPAGLSGGQQQRASLARALVREADLHLLDEPMSQLEPQLRAVLRGRVKALLHQRGITAIFVTHDQTEANALADRIAVMEGGVLQQYGSPDTLRDRPANLFVATFLGEPPMNALPARVVDGGVLAGGLHVPLPGAALPPLHEAVTLGVRPHRVTLGVGSFRGTLTSNQWLGDQAHLAMDVGEQQVVVVSDSRVAERVGAEIAFGIAPAHVHLFGADGRALLHGGLPA